MCEEWNITSDVIRLSFAGATCQCVYCGIKFNNPSNLEVHIKHYCEYTNFDLGKFANVTSHADAQTDTSDNSPLLTTFDEKGKFVRNSIILSFSCYCYMQYQYTIHIRSTYERTYT